MTMFTRCVNCGAAFRVTLEHLQASAGQVRCGVCETVFDAFASLTASDPRGGAAPPPSAVPADAAPSGAATPAAALDQPAEAGQGRPAPAAGAAAPGASRAAGPVRPPATAAAQPRAVAPAPARGADPEWPPAPVRQSGSPWAALTVLLSVAALLQGAYFLRAELAARAPAFRPWLEQACLPLGCSVPLPRATEELSIEGSDLRALDPARPGRVLLTATIRNRAPFTQTWPMLELTLTNVRDEAVIRRAFSAAEYLAPAAPGAGIGPGAEATLRMRLEAQDLQPVGYRLYLFHP